MLLSESNDLPLPGSMGLSFCPSSFAFFMSLFGAAPILILSLSFSIRFAVDSDGGLGDEQFGILYCQLQ